MRLIRCRFPLLLATAALAAAEPARNPEWNRVQVSPMKTSLYIGSATLTTQPFVRDGGTLTATYQADVFPWFFWNETGRITLQVTADELAKLRRGERCTFTGGGLNQKNRPRPVTGYADPDGPDHGRIKVRVTAHDVTLVFNGTYILSERTALPSAPVAGPAGPQASAVQ
ncbi:MAG: hypothetical protein ACHQ4G_05725 [Opitutales bacterium]